MRPTSTAGVTTELPTARQLLRRAQTTSVTASPSSEPGEERRHLSLFVNHLSALGSATSVRHLHSPAVWSLIEASRPSLLMSGSVPAELWRSVVLPCLPVCELVAARATGRSHAAVITAELLLQRIDALLSRHGLTGLIDVDRTTPSPNQPGGLIDMILGCLQRLRACARRLAGRRLTRFGYLVRCLFVLEQGGSEWRLMDMAVRLAAIYRLTPNGLPLVLSVAQLHSKSAFDSLPLAIAIYRLIGHQLTHRGQSLALRRAANGEYRIGDWSFLVVPLGELPADHPYRSTYKKSDPVVRDYVWLLRSFTSFLTWMVLIWWSDQEGVGEKEVLWGSIGCDDPCYLRLLTAGDIPEHMGITADHRCDGGDLNQADPRSARRVVVSGFRPSDTVAAFVLLGWGASAC
ncbi:unnamed protein product [Vitrella brassicaformis CCMP3155]|uniref:Uncharacterized protein n=1 Tax=Vitrella brassicaformis (strain CCMP3155) TaxID=1169540 RepID=A0A0G4EN94_VITBC|nr:unnamed protein product [Vitrella brassicaformis CCMP3155]|eukprot:CEL98596.1 unnamed protein product [Vitrella brassicaformis CCMP3155]